MNRFLIIIFSLFFIYSSSAQTLIQIGTGTNVTTNEESSPVNINCNSDHSQIIYTAAEISAAGGSSGLIYQLGFYIESLPDPNYFTSFPTYSIKMKHTTSTDVSVHDDDTFQEVLLINNYIPSLGYDMLIFDTPFLWNGIDNILIDVCFGLLPYRHPSGTVRSSDFNQGYRYTRSNTSNTCDQITGAIKTIKPNIQLGMVLADNDAGIFTQGDSDLLCSGNQDIIVNIINAGSDVLNSVTIDWTINGQQQTPILWDTPIASGNTAPVTLGNILFQMDQPIDIKAWTSLPNGVIDTFNINDTLYTTLNTALAGAYTIGGSNPDFISINDAVDYINETGICGPVEFLLRAGTYEEQIIIKKIKGASDTNTITFRSESMNAADVIITNDSASYDNNYTLNLNGAEWIELKYLTFKSTNLYSFNNVINIINNSTEIIISDNIIKLDSLAQSQYDYLIYINSSNQSNITISKNVFLNSGSGIYVYRSNINITENIFKNQYHQAIRLYNTIDFTISKNIFTNNTNFSPDQSAINISPHSGNGLIEKNQIISTSNGIYFSSINGTSNEKIKVINNFISIDGSNEVKGIYINNSDYIDFYNNTIRINNSNDNSTALYISDGNSIRFYNNIIANFNKGYLAYGNSSLNFESNYNNFFTSNSTFSSWDNTLSSNFEEWKSFHSYDSQSINVNPYFSSDSSYVVYQYSLKNIALPLTEVTDDIESTYRDSSPDIGAFEIVSTPLDIEMNTISFPCGANENDLLAFFKNNGSNEINSAIFNWSIDGVIQNPIPWSGSLNSGEQDSIALPFPSIVNNQEYLISVWSTLPNNSSDNLTQNDSTSIVGKIGGLEGEFTIGGTDPDYATITDAVLTLNNSFVCGPVIFNIRDGIYNEQLSINEIEGSSHNNTITFQSESLDSSKVKIIYAPNSNNNYVLKLNGTDWTRFDHLSIKGSSSGTVVSVSNSASNNIFSNSHISTISTTSISDHLVYIFGNNNYNTFSNNLFIGGNTGIYVHNFSHYLNQELTIDNNTFVNQYYYGIYAYRQPNIIIRKNTITSDFTNSNYLAMYLRKIYTGGEISKNKIYGLTNGSGLVLTDADVPNGQKMLVSNNFIHINSEDNDHKGISIENGERNYFYHNTIFIENKGNAFEYSGQYHRLNNNILSCFGGGYAIKRTSSSSITSDNNNLYSTGTLAYYYSDKESLTEWQNASNQDANSINVNPNFINNNSFEVSNSDLINSGTSISYVLDDIEGELRDSLPDIGADEFQAFDNDASIITFIPSQAPFKSGNQPVKVLLKNNGNTPITNVLIKWEVNNIPQNNFNWTGNLDFQDTTTLILGSYNFSSGNTYRLEAWTRNPNNSQDQFPQNDKCILENLNTTLDGVYTIGGINPDFDSFTDASNALEAGGICGAVTFNVRDGIYTEVFSLGDVEGSSEINNITFRSESLDSSSVTITNTSTSSQNGLILLEGVDWLTIEHMTLKPITTTSSVCINIGEGSNNITINNNRFEGINTSSTSDNKSLILCNQTLTSNNNIKNNHFQDNAFGVRYTGLSSNLLIENNTFSNQSSHALYLSNQYNYSITGNTIFSDLDNPDVYGMAILNSPNSSSSRTIAKNKIILNNGYGIYIDDSSNSLLNIFNNYISIANGNKHGIYIETEYTNISNNTINLQTNTTGNNLTFYDCNEVQLYNNIFINKGVGKAIDIDYMSNGLLSDYNCFYVAGNTLAQINSYTSNTFAEWQDYDYDLHSINLLPTFINDQSYQTNDSNLISKGVHLPYITDDIEGNPRLDSPEIGAYEFNTNQYDAGIIDMLFPPSPFATNDVEVFVTLHNFGTENLTSAIINWSLNNTAQTPINWVGNLAPHESINVSFDPIDLLGYNNSISTWTELPNGFADQLITNDSFTINNLGGGLAGIYTIGGIAPDFDSFTQATEALNNWGIIGEVIFNIRDGIYEEQICIKDVVGTNAANTITFQSESNDSSLVILTDSLVNSGSILKIENTNWLTFKGITVASTSANFSNNVLLKEETNNISFLNCHFKSDHISTNTSTLITCDDTTNNFLLQSSVFENTTIGVDFSSHYSTSVILKNNTFINQSYSAISINGILDSIIIEDNIFESNEYMTIPIYLSNCNGYGSIQNNDFNLNRASTIMLLRDIESTVDQPYLIKKNTIDAHTSTNGIKIDDGHHQIFDSNYISIANCDYMILSEDGSFQDFINNTIINTDGASGIRLKSIDGSADDPILIANNFIAIQGIGGHYPIDIFFSSYLNFYNNSVNWTDTSIHGSLMYGIVGSNIKIINNNFATDGARILSLHSVSNLISDNNNLYTEGPSLAEFGNDILFPTLLDWQVEGYDLNSISTSPNFISISDLHTNNLALHNTGTVLPEITTDIDGEPRDSFPDIGADEFDPYALDVGIAAVVMDSTIIKPGNETVEVLLKNFSNTPLTSVNINWEVNGVIQNSFAWTGNLAYEETTLVQIGSYNFLSGEEYSINAWTSLPNNSIDSYHSNNEASLTDLYTLLEGIFTIGGTNPNYETFNDAVDALENVGICGPVTFNVRDGLYEEQISINEIVGTDSINTVTFQSESLDPNTVSIYSEHDPIHCSNYSQWLIFNSLTFEAEHIDNVYRRVLNLNNSSNNTFNNNIFKFWQESTNTGTIKSTVIYISGASNNNIFINNKIINGDQGFYSSSHNINSLTLESNELINQNYNGFISNSVTITNLLIKRNTITSKEHSPTYKGIALRSSEGIITQNKIFSTFYGIEIRGYSNYTNSIDITNNFIQTNSENGGYGYYCSSYQDVSFINNTVKVLDQGDVIYTTSPNLEFKNNNLCNFGGGYVYNLPISNSSFEPIPINSDYNNLYSTGDLVRYNNNIISTTIEEWRMDSNQDNNSISHDPFFLSDTSYQISNSYLLDSGTPTFVTEDIEGEIRDALPDIGADEFAPLLHDAAIVSMDSTLLPLKLGTHPIKIILQNLGSAPLTEVQINWEVNGIPQSPISWTGNLDYRATTSVFIDDFTFEPASYYSFRFWTTNPNNTTDEFSYNDEYIFENIHGALSGEYTIGGASPDFETFAQAEQALETGGVCGPVIFNVRDGIYNTQVSIDEVPGTSAENSITFRSESLDASQVTLTYNDDFVFKIGSPNSFTIEYLTIKPIGDTDGLLISNYSDDQHDLDSHNIINNIFENTQNEGALINSGFNSKSHLLIENNLFISGYRGIIFDNNNMTILNNEFIDQNIGIQFDYSSNFTISGNKITSDIYNAKGIASCSCSPNVYYFNIEKNNIRLINSGTGIYLQDVDVSNNETIIKNNFVSVSNNSSFSSSYGIYIIYSQFIKVIHNTVTTYNLQTPSSIAPIGATFFVDYSNNIFAYNNIFYNDGTSYIFGDQTSNTDYNNIYSNYDLTPWFNTSTFEEYQSYSAHQNSISVDPSFANDTDLHVFNEALKGTGTPYPGVTEDIDGDPRDPNNPDIGADEFTPCYSPSDIIITLISGTTVKVEWLNHDQIDKYKLRYRPTGGSWIEVQSEYPLYFLNGLETETTYEYQLKSRCGTYNTTWTASDYFTTGSDVCNPPVITSVDPLSAISMKAHWLAEPTAEKYKVTYKEKNTSAWTTFFTSLTNATLIGISPDTEYKLKVKSKCSGGYTNWTSTTFVSPPTLTAFGTNDNSSTPIDNRNTSTVQFAEATVLLYPNPANESINLEFTNFIPNQFLIFDATGKQLLQIDQEQSSIDISSLHNGTYFIKMQSKEGKVLVKNFIKY